MRVRLKPLAGSEDTRVFDVMAADLNTTTGELELACCDGTVCVGLQGSWEMSIRESSRPPMSVDEVTRIHAGVLVTIN